MPAALDREVDDRGEQHLARVGGRLRLGGFERGLDPGQVGLGGGDARSLPWS